MIKGLSSNGDTGTIHIVLTNFCNLGCKGCYQPEEERSKQNQSNDNNILNEDNLLEIENLFIKFTNENKDINLSFFGGEPLYRQSNIIKILNWIHSRNLKPNKISIPTSGGKNQNLIYNIEPLIELVANKFPNTKLVISLSYDGVNNEELRNINPEAITVSYRFLKSLGLKYKSDERAFYPEFISCLIPQVIDQNYFVDNYINVMNITGNIPNFRIPHLLDANSNLDTWTFSVAVDKFFWYITSKDFITDNSKGYRTRYLLYLYKTNQLPKLFKDIIDLIFNPLRYQNDYNWCQAGKSHFTITPDGKHKNDCEYLHKPATDLHSKQMEHCNKCEIKQWCNKPCLKSIEISEEQFLRHCTIRKILLNQLRKMLVPSEPK